MSLQARLEALITAIGADMKNMLSRNMTANGSEADPQLKSTYTGANFSTLAKNTLERWVPYRAGAAVSAQLAGYLNEWGALRGESPFTWGDSLVRAIKKSGHGITAGNAFEIEDRTVVLGDGKNLRPWGRSWVDGSLVRNSYSVREAYVWITGDADPTVGGTVPLPANGFWFIVLTTKGGAVPSWSTTANSLVVEPQ